MRNYESLLQAKINREICVRSAMHRVQIRLMQLVLTVRCQLNYEPFISNSYIGELLRMISYTKLILYHPINVPSVNEKWRPLLICFLSCPIYNRIFFERHR